MVSPTTGLPIVVEAAWGTESVLGSGSTFRGMVTERRGSGTLRSPCCNDNRLNKLEVKEDTFLLQGVI
jgi:hypothetical protein